MIIKILCGLLATFFIYERLTRSYLSIYTCEVYFGKKGAGKSTLATKMAIKHLEKGWHVYANFYIPGCYQYDVDDFGSFGFLPHSLVICDEAGILFNNRDFKTLKPEVRQFLALQRKYEVKTVFFSQSYNVDKAIRDLADCLYVVGKIARIFTVTRKVNKKIGIQNSLENGGQLVEQYSYVGLPKLTFIPRWTCLFDSYEKPEMVLADVTYNKLNEIQKKLTKSTGFISYKFQQLCTIFKALGKGSLKISDDYIYYLLCR